MNGRDSSDTPRHVLLIVTAAVAMAGLIVALGPMYMRRGEATPAPVPPAPSMDQPIAAEADVFRTAPEDLAVPPVSPRRPGAHRRTLAMYRAHRAFPGAPPRVPHGLTSEEFRDGSCNTCHERGGYVARFATYAPVTPHPEYRNCLQCHVPEDDIVGMQASGPGTDARCFQCHVPGGRTPPFVAVDWRALQAPRTEQRAMPGAPPAIPHDLQLRGNCVACHAGPAAVEEIQTLHPERANCRQCHVPAAAEVPEFTRPLDAAAERAGGDS